jgi:4a-hydroxytetrahydrobiopterin dehydratase
MREDESTYDRAEVVELLKSLPGWSYNGSALERRYTTSGWGPTLMVVNAIGFACEAAGHHPDLAVSWSSVGVRFWTHSVNGITEKDFEAARLIDATVLWSPPAGSSLKGPQNEIVRGDG